MSISTKGGDSGRTSLPGGERTSKADPRVECYGTIDEMVSQIGFARSICGDAEMNEWLKAIQRGLFHVGAVIGAAPDSTKSAPEIGQELTAALDEHVRQLENVEGILKDWALPGELPAAAALDVARTVARRAERLAVQLAEAGTMQSPGVLTYLNRLSDVLWLFARLLELRAKVDSSLRGEAGGSPWSRSW